jgi:mitochondrial chaperone BCS1
MPSNANLSSSPLRKLQAIKAAIWHTSIAMGTGSEYEVRHNFFQVLKKAGPSTYAALMLTIPWIVLASALSRYNILDDQLKKLREWMKESLRKLLYASITIEKGHHIFDLVTRWYMNRGAGSLPSGLLLKCDFDASYPSWFSHRSIQQDKADEEKALLASGDAEQGWDFSPAYDKYPVYFRGRRFTFEFQCIESDNRRTKHEKIIISCFSLFKGAAPIRELLTHIKRGAMVQQRNKTTIHQSRGGYSFGSGIHRAARALDAVTLPDNVKHPLVRDITAYLDKRTKQYYANRGIPWRRGYLYVYPDVL